MEKNFTLLGLSIWRAIELEKLNLFLNATSLREIWFISFQWTADTDYSVAHVGYVGLRSRISSSIGIPLIKRVSESHVS